MMEVLMFKVVVASDFGRTGSREWLDGGVAAN